jgi:hypothetical protein
MDLSAAISDLQRACDDGSENVICGCGVGVKGLCAKSMRFGVVLMCQRSDSVSVSPGKEGREYCPRLQPSMQVFHPRLGAENSPRGDKEGIWLSGLGQSERSDPGVDDRPERSFRWIGDAQYLRKLWAESHEQRGTSEKAEILNCVRQFHARLLFTGGWIASGHSVKSLIVRVPVEWHTIQSPFVGSTASCKPCQNRQQSG